MNPSQQAPARIDAGRVVAVSFFVLMLLLNLPKLFSGALDDPFGSVTSLLIAAFYVLLILSYLRRAPTDRTDRQWTSWLVAFLGTAAPFVIPLVSGGTRTGPAATGAIVVLVVGLVAMLWSLGALGTNISMVPQAREVVTHGPYARVRHPLYAAELLNVVGICLGTIGFGPWLVLIALIVFQVLRARREEALLSSELPGYAEYKARTPMLVPALGGS